jgi:putative ABC transport system substrate-binding protein
VKESQLAAQTLGIRLHVIRVTDPVEIEGALKAIPDGGALMVADDAVLTAYRTQIGTLALKKRLATVYGFSDMVDAGGLMSYGPHYGDMYRRAAVQVAKILRGTKAGDLPIEQPLKFEFVINLKTAKALGLTIPPSLLARADRVIE